MKNYYKFILENMEYKRDDYSIIIDDCLDEYKLKESYHKKNWQLSQSIPTTTDKYVIQTQLINSIVDDNDPRFDKFVEEIDNVNYKNGLGYSPIFYASCLGKLEKVKKLIRKGAILEGDEIVCASNKNHFTIVKYLLPIMLRQDPTIAYKYVKYMTPEQKDQYKEYITLGKDFDIFENVYETRGGEEKKWIKERKKSIRELVNIKLKKCNLTNIKFTITAAKSQYGGREFLYNIQFFKVVKYKIIDLFKIDHSSNQVKYRIHKRMDFFDKYITEFDYLPDALDYITLDLMTRDFDMFESLTVYTNSRNIRSVELDKIMKRYDYADDYKLYRADGGLIDDIIKDNPSVKFKKSGILDSYYIDFIDESKKLKRQSILILENSYYIISPNQIATKYSSLEDCFNHLKYHDSLEDFEIFEGTSNIDLPKFWYKKDNIESYIDDLLIKNDIKNQITYDVRYKSDFNIFENISFMKYGKDLGYTIEEIDMYMINTTYSLNYEIIDISPPNLQFDAPNKEYYATLETFDKLEDAIEYVVKKIRYDLTLDDFEIFD